MFIDVIDIERLWLGYDKENRPKQCEICHLGHYYVFFYLLLVTTPTLASQGPNNGLPSFGHNNYYFKYIFALFSSINIYKLYFYFYL